MLHLAHCSFRLRSRIYRAQNGIRNNASANFTKAHLKTDSENIHGVTNFVGGFHWTIDHDGAEVASAFNNINALTGNLHSGNIVSTQHFAPIITDEGIITYGFYDAVHGEAGLTNHDQCYVIVCSQENESWMSVHAPLGSPEAEQHAVL